MWDYLKLRLTVIIFVVMVFLLGIIFGSSAVKSVSYDVRENIFSYFSTFLGDYHQMTYSRKSLFVDSIKVNLLSMFIIWAVGMSVFIMPVVVVIIFFKGFILGFTVGFLISEFSFKGVVIAALTVFPHNIFVVPVFMLGAVIAIYFTYRIIRYYLGREKLKLEDFINYTLQMSFLSLILLCASLIEVFVSPLLLSFII